MPVTAVRWAFFFCDKSKMWVLIEDREEKAKKYFQETFPGYDPTYRNI